MCLNIYVFTILKFSHRETASMTHHKTEVSEVMINDLILIDVWCSENQSDADRHLQK